MGLSCGPRADSTGAQLIRALDTVLRSSDAAVKALAACYSGNPERFMYRELRKTLFDEEWMVGEAAYEEITPIVETISSIIDWVTMTYQPQTKFFQPPSVSPRLFQSMSDTSSRLSFTLGMLRNIIDRTASINAQLEREWEILRRDQPSSPVRHSLPHPSSPPPMRPVRTNTAPPRRFSFRASDTRQNPRLPTDKEVRWTDIMRVKQALLAFEVNLDALRVMVELAELYLGSGNFGYWVKGADTGKKGAEICRQILLSKAGFMKEFYSIDELPVDPGFREHWIAAVKSSPTSRKIFEIA